MNTTNGRVLDLNSIFHRLRKRWLWLVLPVIVLTVAALAWSLSRPPSFSATARVLLTPTAAEEALGSGVQNAGFLTRELSNEVSIATSDAVRANVEQRFAADDLGLVPNVRVSTEDGADVLVFRAQGRNPERVAAGANIWAEIYIETKRSEALASITSAVDSLRGRIAVLEDQRDQVLEPDSVERVLLDAEVTVLASSITDLQLRADLASTGTARMLQVAAVPGDSNNTSSVVVAIVGAILGLGLGVFVASLRDSVDQTISSEQDILAEIDIPILGQIPRPNRRASPRIMAHILARNPDSSVAGSIRVLRSALEFSLVDRQVRTLLITSPGAGEGKTTLSTNLAWANASAGQSTAIVDVDYRRPRLHDVYDFPQAPGLSDCVASNHSLSGAIHEVEHPYKNLFALMTGTPPAAPGDFVAAPKFASAIADLPEPFDLTILDGPPILPISDSLSIAPHVDAVMVVVRADSTTTEDLRTTLSKLRVAGANVIGCVIVGVNSERRYGYYRSKVDGRSVPHQSVRSLDALQEGSDLLTGS